MKRIISFLIIFSSLINSDKALSEIKLMGTTNDNDLIYFNEQSFVNQKDGWTYFEYLILKQNGKINRRIGGTPFCYQGKVKLNPNVTNIALSSVGWLVNVDEKLIVVNADSEASKKLLKNICEKL